MKRFVVQIKDTQGHCRTYEINAQQKETVEKLVRQRSWQLVSIREKQQLRLSFSPQLSYTMLAFFFRQLSTMIHAGIPFVEAWRLLLQDIRPQKKRLRMERAALAMERGASPSVSMEQTQLFPLLACQMVRAGEQGGRLEEILLLLSEYYEYAQKQRQLLRSALAYPLFLVGCTFTLCIGAIWYILPVFENMFVQMALPLPQPTQYLLDAAKVVRTYSWCLAVPTVLVVLSIPILHAQPSWGLTMEETLLQISWVRSWWLMLCWQRCSRILAIQLGSGIPLLQALQDAVKMMPSLWFRHGMKKTVYRLENGTAFSLAVRQGGFGTPYVETMLQVGEMTGRYEESLQSIAAYYRWRLERGTAMIQQCIGPAVLLLAGICIGTLVICLLLPLFDMATSIAV